MAGQWVDDPSWGNVFDGFFQSGGKAGQIQLTAEHIKGLQLKRAIEQADEAARQASIGAINPRYDAMQPSRFLPDPNAGAPYEGGIGDVLANSIPPTTAAGDEPFYRTREQARADEILGTRLSKNAKDIASSRGLGQVYSTGVPTTLPEWQRVQTMLKGEMPTSDPGATLTQHNYNIYDAGGNIVRQGVMQGNIDLQTRQPINSHVPSGGYARIVQPLAADVKGPISTEENRLELIRRGTSEYEQSGKVANPLDIAMAFQVQFPTSLKVQRDSAGNEVPMYEGKMMPGVSQGLIDHINSTIALRGQPQPQQPQQPQAVPYTTGEVPTVGAQTPPAPNATPLIRQPGLPPNFQLQAPAPQGQGQTAQRVTSASAERLAIENAIKGGYLPPLSSALINTIVQGSTGAAGFAADQLLKYMDPKGAEYFLNAMRWVEPVIRSASGAAIQPREYADYYRMFIPTANDPPRVVQAKLEAMRRWEQATATGMTANGVLQLMAAQTQPGTATAAIVERLRVKAQQAGTLAAPNPYAGVGVGTRSDAPTPDAGAVDPNEVNRILGR